MQRRSVFRYIDRFIGIPILILLGILLKRRKRLPIENIKKILIIKLAAIGDSILLIPMLRTLRKSFPDSEISFVCSSINRSVIDKIPYINKIINCEIYSFLKSPLKFIQFISYLRKTNYDVVIDAGQWERINSIITILIRYQFSIGFKTKKQYRHYIYDKVVPHYRNKHELENFLDLLIPLGIYVTAEDRKLEYFLKDENREFALQFWKEHELDKYTVVCLHAGCGDNGKPREWADENYINLGKRLVQYDKNIRVLLTGAPNDIPRCKAIEEGIKENVINITGIYQLDDVVAVIEKVKLIVCSNTGMLHIAACFNTKTLGLHGPTDPVKWGAYNKNSVLIQSDKFCSPCLYLGHDYGCQAPQCMAHISVDEVFIYIRKALNPELFTRFVNIEIPKLTYQKS